MKVKTPILSVRQLVRDGHEVYINAEGGWIRNVENNKWINVVESQGVFYLKTKITKPCAHDGKEDQPLFSGRRASARIRSIFVL